MQDDCSSDEELDKLAKEDIKKELEWMEEDLKKEGLCMVCYLKDVCTTLMVCTTLSLDLQP